MFYQSGYKIAMLTIIKLWSHAVIFLSIWIEDGNVDHHKAVNVLSIWIDDGNVDHRKAVVPCYKAISIFLNDGAMRGPIKVAISRPCKS